jgi:hypothetical protein
VFVEQATREINDKEQGAMHDKRGHGGSKIRDRYAH